MENLNNIFEEMVDVCQDFCDNNGIDVEVEFDSEFCYYPIDHIVSITPIVMERIDDYFLANAFNHGLKFDCGVFILSFFHEIGHHYTLPLLSLRQHKLRVRRKQFLVGRNAWSKKAQFKYFNLLDEKMATAWAINYINNNAEIIKPFAEKLSSLINEIELEE